MDNMYDIQTEIEKENFLLKTKQKNSYLKIIIGVLLIILIGIIAHLFGYLRNENRELSSKINDIGKIEKLNANLVITYDEQVNRTKVIEKERNELLKKIEQLEKKNDDINSKLNEQIEKCNNDSENQKNLFDEKEKTLVRSTQNECFAVVKKLYNENRATNWTEVQTLADNFHQIPENNAPKSIKAENSDNKIQLNCSENEQIANLIQENKKLKDSYDDLEHRYEEKYYAEENLAASSRGENPVTEGTPIWTQIASFFSTSSAHQNNINPLLIILLFITTILLFNKL